MTRFFALFTLLSLFFAALACSVDAPPVESKGEYPVYWDSRLEALNVTYHPAVDCSEGCWRLYSAVFEDSHESGGQHHIFGRLTVDGQSPAGLAWHVAYPDGDVRILTKAAPEWSDFPMFAEYDPDEGEAGPYYAYAGDAITYSDVVRGLGLPERQHVNFRLIWVYDNGGGSTPTPAPTATPTPTPPPPLPYRLGLPLVSKH